MNETSSGSYKHAFEQAPEMLKAGAGSKLLHEKVSSEDKKIVIYDALYHEILNEPERGQVMADILQWLAPRIIRG